jgi:hypothetical protein
MDQMIFGRWIRKSRLSSRVMKHVGADIFDDYRKIFVNLNYGKVDHQYPRNKKRFGKAAAQRAWGGISIAWQKGGYIGG